MLTIPFPPRKPLPLRHRLPGLGRVLTAPADRAGCACTQDGHRFVIVTNSLPLPRFVVNKTLLLVVPTQLLFIRGESFHSRRHVRRGVCDCNEETQAAARSDQCYLQLFPLAVTHASPAHCTTIHCSSLTRVLFLCCRRYAAFVLLSFCLVMSSAIDFMRLVIGEDQLTNVRNLSPWAMVQDLFYGSLGVVAIYMGLWQTASLTTYWQTFTQRINDCPHKMVIQSFPLHQSLISYYVHSNTAYHGTHRVVAMRRGALPTIGACCSRYRR